MTLRTVLLTIHIISAAGWIGADLIVHLLTRRLRAASDAVRAEWARSEQWMHERYYPLLVVPLLVTGIWLVIDGDWSWSGGFIWVGVGAIVVGASLGGGGLGGLAKKKVAAWDAGDAASADALAERMIPISYVITAAPIVAVLAMVDKWMVG